MGDPGALPGEETEERGDLLFPTFNVFSLHLLNKFTIIKKYFAPLFDIFKALDYNDVKDTRF